MNSTLSDPDTTPESVHRSPRWLVYAGIAGLFLLALALRLFRAGSTPLGGHGDVAWIGINALDWLQHGIWPFYIYELYAPEPAIVYSAALSIATWGVSFFASRLPTIIAGALTVPVDQHLVDIVLVAIPTTKPPDARAGCSRWPTRSVFRRSCSARPGSARSCSRWN